MRSERDGRRRFNSLRRHVEYPCENKRDRKTNQQQRDNDPNHGVRNLENRKDLSQTLCERPARNDVGDRDAINFAPLQFIEEARHRNRFALLNVQRQRLDRQIQRFVHLTPVAKTVWNCGFCFSRETTFTSMSRKPPRSSSSCNRTSLKPSQRSA